MQAILATIPHTEYMFLWDFDCSWRKWIYSFVILNSPKPYSLTISQLSVIVLSKDTFLKKGP